MTSMVTRAVLMGLCVWAWPALAAAQQAPQNFNDYFVQGKSLSSAFGGGSTVCYTYNYDTNFIGGGVDTDCSGTRGLFSGTGTADGTGRGKAFDITSSTREYDCVAVGTNPCGQLVPRPAGGNTTRVQAEIRTARVQINLANSANGSLQVGNSFGVLHDVLQFTVAGASAQTVTRVNFEFASNGSWSNTVAAPGALANAGDIEAYLCLDNFQSQGCRVLAASAIVILNGVNPGVPTPQATAGNGPNGTWTSLTANSLVYRGFFDIVGPTMTLRPTIILRAQGEVATGITYTSTFSFTNLPANVRYTSASGEFLPLPIPTAPGAPTNVQALATGNNLNLTWGAPATGDAPTSYTVLGRVTPSGAPVVAIPVGTATSFSTGAPNGTFLLSVVASNDAGTGPESALASVTFPGSGVAAPGAPTGLGVSVAGTTATFTWSPPASGGVPAGYVLQAGTSPGFTVPLASLPLPVAPTSVSIPGIPPGTYYIRLVSQNAGGTSGPSNEITLTVAGASAPGAPTLSASATGHTVTVSWTPGSGGTPTSYTLSAAVTSGGAPVATVPLGGTSASFANVPSGTYYLRLTASNGAGTSAASNQVTVTVP